MQTLKSILKFIKSTFLLLFLICLIVFMVNNRDIVIVHLTPLPFDIETRAFLLIIVSFSSGILFGFLAVSQNLFSRMIKGAKDNKKIKKLEKQVAKS